MRTFFAFALAIALALSGCKPKPDNGPPVAVHIESLWRVHRDSPDLAHSAWGNRRIRVILRPGDYKTHNFDVHWHNGHPNDPPVVVFHCDRPIVGNEGQIEIIGLCTGKTKDSLERDSSIDWHVSVSDCTVTRGSSSR